MGLSTKLIVSGAVAGVALTYYVRARRERTGESYLAHRPATCPAHALRWVDDTKARAIEGPRRGQESRPATATRNSPGRLAAGAPPGA